MNNSAEGIVVQGYGIASGKHSDNRFPQGSISMQFPFFKKCGFDVSHFFMGTINISFRNFKFELINPVHHFPKVKWCADLPAENFSFYPCSVSTSCNSFSESFTGFVYWPHPSTKPEFHQDSNVIEVILPFIPDIKYGVEVKIKALNESISFSASF